MEILGFNTLCECVMPDCYLNFMHYMRLILRVKKYVESDKLNVRMN